MAEDREVTANRGRRAQELLDHDLLKDAFKALEDGYVEAWRTTAATDTVGREKLFLAINVVGKVRDHLAKVAADGKLAAKEIQIMIAEEERKKLFGLI
jgi:hypothetical protein